MADNVKDYLKELVAFQSISSDESMSDTSRRTAEFIVSKLQKIGVESKILENLVEGKNPLILGIFGFDPHKKTIMCYCHYDVQPAAKEDGWDTDPFELIEQEGYLFGRGASDDKGPIAATYFAIKELLDEGDLPVNVAFLYEGEEESGSGGFEETVSANRDFFGKIDGLLILDGGWFGDKRPSLGYGTRGVTYMGIEISGPKQDVHSGAGGSMFEPMDDLIKLMSNLKNPEGKILINGFYDKVNRLTDEEIKLYDDIEFDLDAYKKHYGIEQLPSTDSKELLMNMWRYPSLSLHGIEGAFSGPRAKTVIPSKVIGKVSMRLVPDQDPEEIAELFEKYIRKEFEKLESGNKLNFQKIVVGDWWYGDPNNDLFRAGIRAMEDYWHINPSLIRGGGSVPIIPFMEKIFDAPAMGPGIGQSTDGAHSQNERIRIKNLEGGTEVIKLLLKNLK